MKLLIKGNLSLDSLLPFILLSIYLALQLLTVQVKCFVISPNWQDHTKQLMFTSVLKRSKGNVWDLFDPAITGLDPTQANSICLSINCQSLQHTGVYFSCKSEASIHILTLLKCQIKSCGSIQCAQFLSQTICIPHFFMKREHGVLQHKQFPR